MAIQYKKGAAALVLGLGLAATPALADENGQGASGEAQGQRGVTQGKPGGEATQAQQQQQQQQGQRGFGAGVGTSPQCPSCEPGGAGIGGWSPGGIGQQGQGMYGGGPGVSAGGPSAQQVSVPHYWLADAALFTGNAANTANVLYMEQGLNVQAPQVLGNQAQFLLTATNRALTSLLALQKNAEATNPDAVPEIRGAVAQLIAAQAQATQVADAANAGVLGPTLEASIRATTAHLAAAEKAMAAVGRAYGAPQLAAAGTCATRAFGAGLGVPRGITPVKPRQQQRQQPKQQQPQPQEPQGGSSPEKP